MWKIVLKGVASNKKWQFDACESEMKMNLLEFLESKQIPIASSCRGEGVCKKCIFNGCHLACQVSVEEITGDVDIDYL